MDPRRGGCVSRLTIEGRELLHAGRVGNELLVYDEYPAHPRYHEGPWHLVPNGTVTGSASTPASSVHTETSALGQRITVTGTVGPVRYTQTLTLWHGVDRLDGVTHIDAFDGADRLLRLRWPARVPGALPVSEVANAVIGRGFGLIDVDSTEHPGPSTTRRTTGSPCRPPPASASPTGPAPSASRRSSRPTAPAPRTSPSPW